MRYPARLLSSTNGLIENSTAATLRRESIRQAANVMAASVWCALLSALVQAQGTLEDYQRAERFLPNAVKQLAFEGHVTPNWIEQSSQFWYLKESPAGKDFILFDLTQGTRASAFNQEKLAASLSRAAGKPYQPRALPFDFFEFSEGRRAILFNLGRIRWSCNLTPDECKPVGEVETTAATGQRQPARDQEGESKPVSPDGKFTTAVKNHNLYLRVVATGEEIQLSRDGERFYDYATPLPSPMLMVQQGTEDVVQPPAVFWSPDSKRLVTFVMDQRNFPRFSMLQSVPPSGFRPQSYSYAYPLPVDHKLPTASPVVFELATRKQLPVDARPIEMFYYGNPTFTWFADSERFYYRETERAHRSLRLLEVNAATGATRPLVEERAETMVNSTVLWMRLVDHEREIIWSSERDGWNHFYLYDVKTGRQKNQITKGEWVVRGVEHVDEKTRQLYFTAGGREPGRDPYLRHLYRINLDGTGLKLLTPEDADHSISFSRDGKHFVDAYSRADLPTVSVVRSAEDGQIVHELERADVRELQAMGWKLPEPFKGKGRDGKTDIYGLIWRPTHFDRSKKYPVVENIYTGPHSAHVPKTFAAYRHPAQAIAELGFICVFIDGMGTALRSKAFHDVSYRNLGDGGLPDHIALLQQMGVRYQYLDLTKVGVWGHSAGGYDSTHAVLTHPEFYKVAVSSAGNHDHRMDKAWWNESWMGSPVGQHYIDQSNATLAANLKGKLLLAHGDLDENVPIAATIKLVDALIKANKDFDLILMPNRYHALNDAYFIRRRWDFLVRHLLGVTPPENYQIREESIQPADLPSS